MGSIIAEDALKLAVLFLFPTLVLFVVSFSAGWIDVWRSTAVVSFMMLFAILILARFGGGGDHGSTE